MAMELADSASQYIKAVSTCSCLRSAFSNADVVILLDNDVQVQPFRRFVTAAYKFVRIDVVPEPTEVRTAGLPVTSRWVNSLIWSDPVADQWLKLDNYKGEGLAGLVSHAAGGLGPVTVKVGLCPIEL